MPAAFTFLYPQSLLQLSDTDSELAEWTAANIFNGGPNFVTEVRSFRREFSKELQKTKTVFDILKIIEALTSLRHLFQNWLLIEVMAYRSMEYSQWISKPWRPEPTSDPHAWIRSSALLKYWHFFIGAPNGALSDGARGHMSPPRRHYSLSKATVDFRFEIEKSSPCRLAPLNFRFVI